MTKTETNEVIEAAVDRLKALASMAVDALFWVGWALITVYSGRLIDLLQLTDHLDIIVFRFGQICGCFSMMVLLLSQTLKDLMTIYKDLRDSQKDIFKKP